ncbi:MAG: minor capsid protein [Peptococcaceae bacterium]|nr:minor capsid protein [Peptococcaceae bacterium]
MLIRDIAQILQTNGIGALGVDIFLGQLPASPDNAVVLYPTGGFAQDLPLPDVKMTAQVLVRDKSYQAGYERIWRIFNLLDGGESRFIEAPSGRKMVAQAMQPPFFLERDENGRSVFVFNVSIITRRD